MDGLGWGPSEDFGEDDSPFHKFFPSDIDAGFLPNSLSKLPTVPYIPRYVPCI